MTYLIFPKINFSRNISSIIWIDVRMWRMSNRILCCDKNLSLSVCLNVLLNIFAHSKYDMCKNQIETHVSFVHIKYCVACCMYVWYVWWLYMLLYRIMHTNNVFLVNKVLKLIHIHIHNCKCNNEQARLSGSVISDHPHKHIHAHQNTQTHGYIDEYTVQCNLNRSKHRIRTACLILLTYFCNLYLFTQFCCLYR